MVIWGSKGKTKTIGTGSFYCIRCRADRPYKHIRLARYFTLYFIPLFETKNFGEYIECQVCFTTYETEILNHQRDETEAQEILAKIRNELDAGLSVQAMHRILVDAGADEESAKSALYAATHGQLNICNECQTVYKQSLKYCSVCGTRLSAI